jgi:hypothetical protein
METFWVQKWQKAKRVPFGPQKVEHAVKKILAHAQCALKAIIQRIKIFKNNVRSLQMS